MRALLLVLPVALLACADTKAPTAPAAPAAPAAAPVAPAGPTPFEQKAFACCATPAAVTAVEQYLDVQRALAHDNLQGAVGAATKLAATFDTQAGSASAADVPALKKLADDARALTGTDVAAVRKRFGTLSADIIAWAAPLPAGASAGALRIAKAYCPMADASWLQTEPAISNPYYGAEMLTCGSFQ